MENISRRGLVKGLIAGAVVLGFNPTSRSWVTEASAGALLALPALDGLLSTDPAALAAAADDYGHIVHRTPIAVLYPGSVDDIVKMVKYARAHGLRVSGRGKGHTPFGQSQADAGLVIDMSTLDTIHSITGNQAVVDAGTVWRDLLIATLEQGLTPPVLTDFTGLSVGGTLSVGGLSGTSHRYGAQVDNVQELHVVTGEGKLVICSRTQNRQLFNAALAGLGLCGIIVRATIRLVTARERARTFRIFYPSIPSMLHDLRVLSARGNEGCDDEDDDEDDDQGSPRLDSLQGFASPGAGQFSYYIEAVSYYTAPQDPSASALLAGLGYIPGSLQIDDQTYFEYRDGVYQLIGLLNQLGLGGLPHPWLDLLVPGSAINAFASQTVAMLNPAQMIPGSIVLFLPLVAHRLQQPLLSVPNEEVFFLFDILMTTPPDPAIVNATLQFNRTLYDQNVASGGKHYTISAVQLSPADWKQHFQPEWGDLVSAKHKYDPGNVLGPGPGVFP